MTVASGAYFVWSFRYRLSDGVVVRAATAQPIARLTVDGVPLAVFTATAGITPEFVFDQPVDVTGPAQATDLGGGLVRVSVTKPGTDCVLTIRTDEGIARILVLMQIDDRLSARGAR